MRRLVGVQAVRVLVARARVVDFVEVHAVFVGRLLRHGVLFVDQHIRVGRAPFDRAARRDGLHGDHPPVSIDRRNLPERRARAVKRQADIAPVERNHSAGSARHHAVRVIGRLAKRQPLEALAPVEERAGFRAVAFPVHGCRDGELRIGNPPVIIQVEILLIFAEVEHHRFARRRGDIARLRRFRRAQMPERRDAVCQCQRAHDGEVAPAQVHAVILRMQQLVALALFGRAGRRSVIRVRRLFRLDSALRQGHRPRPHEKANRRIRRQRRGGELHRAERIPQPRVRRNQIIKRQHHADVHRRGRRGQHGGDQQPDIPRLHKREKEQRQRGQDIAFVHLRAQRKDQLHRQRGGEEQAAPAPAHGIDRHARREGERHQHKADLPVGDRADERGRFIHPVAAQQEHQVARRERRVRIAGERRRVFIHQPREDVFAPRKGQHDDKRRRHAAQQAKADGFSAALAQTRLFHQRRHAQRREQPRLRLGQHGQREERDGDCPSPRARIQQHQHQQQRQHGVNLPPAARGHDERRVQRQQRGHGQRRAFAQLFFGPFEADRRQREIAGNRHELHQPLKRHAPRAKPQRPAQQAEQPQHQHIRGRIIAEIAHLIEIRRAAVGHLARPRAKTAHIHAVALDGERQQHADDQRRQQRNRQPCARVQLLPRQAAHQQRRQRHVDAGRADQQRDAPLLRRLWRARVGLFARRRRGQIEHRLADGHGFHLFKAHVREPRLAGVLRAVAAQPRHDRDFLLPFAGSAV